MESRYIYAIIGSGRQGIAAAYDLAKFGDARKIVMADIDGKVAMRAAARVNRLLRKNLAEGVALDAGNPKHVRAFLKDIDCCLGAAHYALNYELTRQAIAAGCHFCDLGGNTDVVTRQHTLDRDAQNAGVTVIPDCGLAPGMGNILAARAIARMNCRSVRVWCGGLPQQPKPPLGYHLVFSIAGLTNEYTGKCTEIRGGKIVTLPAFTEKEEIVFPDPAGRCEAFLTSGGTSTGPWSFFGKVQNYGYKTVRYPGHYDRMRAMIDLGFLDLEPVRVGGVEVAPRELFHVLATRKLTHPNEKDLVVLRVRAKGTLDGKPRMMTQEVLDFFDDETHFSAMERTTAFSAAAVAIMIAQKRVAPGVHAQEKVIDGDLFVQELARRNIHVETTMEDLPEENEQ